VDTSSLSASLAVIRISLPTSLSTKPRASSSSLSDTTFGTLADTAVPRCTTIPWNGSRLRVRCSTNWAMQAHRQFYSPKRLPRVAEATNVHRRCCQNCCL